MARSRERPRPGLWRLVAFACALVLVDTIFFSALTPLLPHYARVAGLSKAAAGILVAAYPAGTLLASLPSGVLVARLGVRRVALAGLALMALATLAFGWASAVPLLDAARLVQGIAGACTWTAALAWVAEAAPGSRRGELLGMTLGSGVVGALFGPAVGTAATLAGTGPAFSSAAIIAALLMAAAFTVPVPRRPGGDAGTDGQALRALLAALRDRQLLAGAWLMMLSGIAFGVIGVLAPLRLSRLGATPAVIGAVYLCQAAAEAGISPLAGRAADRLGPARPTLIALLAGALTGVLYCVAGATWAVIALTLLGNPCFGVLYTPASALLSDGARRARLNQGLGFALGNLTWAAGEGLSAAAGGALAQATSDAVPFALMALACLLSVPAVRRLATLAP